VKLGNDSSDAYEVLSETYRGEAVKGQVFLSGISGSNDVRMSKSRMEAVLITFFDIKDVVRFEFIPQDQTVNKAYYVEISKRLSEIVRRRKPELSPNNWILHHDNAPAHKTLSVKQFLAQKSITEIEHPPCSLDFAPNDFCLFLNVKSALKGRRFQDTDTSKRERERYEDGTKRYFKT
jgi:hypothetical protein